MFEPYLSLFNLSIFALVDISIPNNPPTKVKSSPSAINIELSMIPIGGQNMPMVVNVSPNIKAMIAMIGLMFSFHSLLILYKYLYRSFLATCGTSCTVAVIEVSNGLYSTPTIFVLPVFTSQSADTVRNVSSDK